MTLQTTSSRIALDGDGTTKEFLFPFQCFDTVHIRVIVDEVEMTTGFVTVLNVDAAGGRVVFSAAPAVGVGNVEILRTLPLTQETKLPTESNLPEEQLEFMVDRTVMICQQLQEELGRSIRLDETVDASTIDLTLPDPEPDKVLGWNAAGDALENKDPAGIVSEGDVSGPTGAVNKAVAYFDSTSGKVIKGLASVGTSGQFLKSQGPGQPPVFDDLAGLGSVNGLFRASNVSSSARALPTSGALSGTYIHNGNWTSTGALTIAHGTKIYMNGTFTLNHDLVGTAQSNGGVSASKALAGRNGGGIGGGPGGIYPKGGGCGGGSAAVGGTGGLAVANSAQTGGLAHFNSWTHGGSGGGSGAGNGTNIGAAGGGGGAFFYIEVNGNTSINANITADGAAGTNASGSTGGAGGGGGGGQIVMKVVGTFTLASAKVIAARGGAGGNLSGTTGCKGGGGGGGQVEITASGTITLTGTLVTTAGNKGTGTEAATAGANGTNGAAGVTYNHTPVSSF